MAIDDQAYGPGVPQDQANACLMAEDRCVAIVEQSLEER
jgi:hypothetical protein